MRLGASKFALPDSAKWVRHYFRQVGFGDPNAGVNFLADGPCQNQICPLDIWTKSSLRRDLVDVCLRAVAAGPFVSVRAI